ncbi:MAG: ubiquinol oxidase subunit II [Paracoccaceae bacterium]
MKIKGFEGTVAMIERDLMLTAFGLMLLVVVPVIVLTLVFAWRYRATNTNAAYSPDWGGSPLLESFIWGVPAVLIIGLGTMVWKSTHRLDPYSPIPSDVAATRIQAVAYDWKWLFIYPDLGIATVDEMAFPQDRPLAFQITSEVGLNSFMIRHLGGQIYAMAGMETQLHLWADETGKFEGRNMQYSGEGFSNQTFDALALSTEDFDAWVAKVRDASLTLNADARKELMKPSVSGPVVYYKDVTAGLFETILDTYSNCHGDLDGICG